MYIVVCILVGHELNIKLVGNNENNSSLCISYRQAKSACFLGLYSCIFLLYQRYSLNLLNQRFHRMRQA